MGPLADAKREQRHSLESIAERYGTRSVRLCYPAIATTAIGVIPGALYMVAMTTPILKELGWGGDHVAGNDFALSDMSPHGGSERFMAVMHRTTDEDFAAAFDASGEQSVVVQATDSAGTDGHFNPRVAAHGTRLEWLLVTSLGYQTVVGQRLGP